MSLIQEKPKRLCSQNFNEVICVLCTFNNLLQSNVFHNSEELIQNYKYLCQQYHFPMEKRIADKNGVIQDVLEIYFRAHGRKVKQIKRNIQSVQWGWAGFKLKYQGMTFFHAVAIVHSYVIDSIKLPNNSGVYPWNGHLRGYDDEKLEFVFKIY